MVRAVIDTNVLFEGLTKEGPAGDVVSAWAQRKFVPCVSTALALEYEDVLTRKLGAEKQRFAVPAMQALLDRAEFAPIYFTVRPLSPDPGDDFVIECAFNAGAVLVTHNVRDLRVAEEALGVPVLTPAEFLVTLE